MSNVEERFRKMVEDSQDWFWEFDENANFTYVSPGIRNLLGYEPEELIGVNAFDLMDADEVQRVRRHFDPIAKKYLPFKNLENVNIHKDGYKVVIESSGTPIFDKAGRFRGYRGIDRDITERKATEEALRQIQANLHETKHMAKVGSWQFDIENNRLTWSDETYRIFGFKPQAFDATYEAFLDAVHPDDRALVSDAYSSSIRNGQKGYEVEHRIIRKETGEVRYVLEKCRHERDASGTAVRSIGMVQDITERKVSEVALLAATQSAEAANRAKSLFLAKVSHEIRTPLTTIVGFGELLEDAELTSEHRKYLAAINAASNTLSLLINDILDLSKIDAGELVIKQEDVHLRSLIDNLAKSQEQQIAKQNLSLHVSIDADVPDLLVGDPLRIQQVLLNLLGNAIKFTAQGAISIDVSVVEEGAFRVLLDISVTDTGIGIAAELHERIFEPFVQVFDANSRHYRGSGLGLSISRSLAGLMGGTVELESQVGTGSTFHLLIPLQKKIDETSEKPLPEIESISASMPALNILLAEDNQINIQFIKTVLENLGHKVMTAENGKVALEHLNTNVFDLVLMDIQMPVINGIDALKTLRELEQLSGKHLTVIALTAYALMGDREKYLKMGFDGYLKKPFTTRELVNELVRVVPG
jgi:PAS domain S-box-containing protein